MINTPMIFVLDDDAVSRFIVESIVKSAQMDCRSFCTPGEFLDCVAIRSCDCILLDFNMPVLNGCEVQQMLAQLGVTTPVIMVTGNADTATASAAVKNGAFDYIVKPFTPTDLLRVIREALVSSAIQFGNQPRALAG